MKFFAVLIFEIVFLSLSTQEALERPISYGGILNDVYSIPTSDLDIQRAAQMTSEFIQKYCPETIPKTDDGDFIEADIINTQKMKLQYTEDGVNPHYYTDVKFDREKDYIQRISQLGKISSACDAGIIAFQEVRFEYSRGGYLGPNQAQHLQELLPGYQFVFQPTESFPENNIGRREEGLAIFSKYPIISYDYILLSRNKSDERDTHQRICLHAEIYTPWKSRIHVFVTHLSLSKTGREQSVLEIWEYMQQFSGSAVLMGDFNAEPTEKAIRFLQGHEMINHTQTNGMRDAWLVHHKEPRPDVPGTYKDSEHRDEGLTYSAVEDHLRKRIDYIFVRDESFLEIDAVAIVGQEQLGESAASDHVGVMATVKPCLNKKQKIEE